MTPTYSIAGVREGSSEIEGVVMLNGDRSVTIVTDQVPFAVSPSRNWQDHAGFLIWCEREHMMIDAAIIALVDAREHRPKAPVMPAGAAVQSGPARTAALRDRGGPQCVLLQGISPCSCGGHDSGDTCCAPRTYRPCGG